MNATDPRSGMDELLSIMQMDDSAVRRLILAAQQYDDRALAQIYHLYAERIFRHIYFRLAETERAEELTGEVFVRLLENICDFRLGSQGHAAAFTAWIYRIAHNLIVDEYRRQKVRQQAEPEEEGGEGFRPLEMREEVNLTRIDLQIALKQLTDEQQAVILLRFGEELTNGEIARVLGKTETAVKALQRRALSTLARHLAPGVTVAV